MGAPAIRPLLVMFGCFLLGSDAGSASCDDGTSSYGGCDGASNSSNLQRPISSRPGSGRSSGGKVGVGGGGEGGEDEHDGGSSGRSSNGGGEGGEEEHAGGSSGRSSNGGGGGGEGEGGSGNSGDHSGGGGGDTHSGGGRLLLFPMNFFGETVNRPQVSPNASTYEPELFRLLQGWKYIGIDFDAFAYHEQRVNVTRILQGTPLRSVASIFHSLADQAPAVLVGAFLHHAVSLSVEPPNILPCNISAFNVSVCDRYPGQNHHLMLHMMDYGMKWHLSDAEPSNPVIWKRRGHVKPAVVLEFLSNHSDRRYNAYAWNCQDVAYNMLFSVLGRSCQQLPSSDCSRRGDGHLPDDPSHWKLVASCVFGAIATFVSLVVSSKLRNRPSIQLSEPLLG